MQKSDFNEETYIHLVFIAGSLDGDHSFIGALYRGADGWVVEISEEHKGDHKTQAYEGDLTDDVRDDMGARLAITAMAFGAQYGPAFCEQIPIKGNQEKMTSIIRTLESKAKAPPIQLVSNQVAEA
jgi:hypothetical protein